MPKHLHHLFAQIYNRPQLILPSYAEIFNGALQGRFGIESLTNHEGLKQEAASIQQRALDYEGRYDKQYKATSDGIAIIPIRGTLVSRGGVYPSSGITTYSGIRQRLRAAEADDMIRCILLDIDSPGGMVANVDDTAQLIREVSKTKPVWAMAYDQMTSAAYWLAAAADRIIATKDAQVGSIGVLVMHADYSKMLSEQGININFIHAGARKVEGNPYAPLPEELRERIQSEVNDTYDLFTRRVAELRGISQQAVKNTEAGVFSAAQAITHNLVDEVLAADDVLKRFSQHLLTSAGGFSGSPSVTGATSPTNQQGATSMQPEPKPAAKKAADDQKKGKPTEPVAAGASALLELCEGKEFGFMASALIKGSATMETAETQLAEAGKIRDVMAAAGLEDHAEAVIKECGLLTEGVHKAIAIAITETKAAADPEQENQQPGAESPQATGINAGAIFASRKS